MFYSAQVLLDSTIFSIPERKTKAKYEFYKWFPSDMESQSRRQTSQTHSRASTCSGPQGAFSFSFLETVKTFTDCKSP